MLPRVRSVTIDDVRGAIVAAAVPLRLAVLFGSHARGVARDDSDVDVGIVPVDGELSHSLELDLAARLSASLRAEVDLVRLDRDDPLLAHEVARHGQCVYEGAPGAWAAFRATAVSRWLEHEETFAPFRRRFLERVRNGL